MSRLGPRNIPIRLAPYAAALVVLAVGCAYGSLSPDRQQVLERRGAWIDEVRSRLAYDEIFYLGDRGEVDPVTVKALPLDEALLAKGAELWPGDKRFIDRVASWREGGRQIVLVGLYSRNMPLADDFVKKNPFVASLSSGEGTPAPPDLVELVEGAFLDDYFPVFNRWEKVLALGFKAPLAKDSALTVSWPSGSRRLALAPETE